MESSRAVWLGLGISEARGTGGAGGAGVPGTGRAPGVLRVPGAGGVLGVPGYRGPWEKYRTGTLGGFGIPGVGGTGNTGVPGAGGAGPPLVGAGRGGSRWGRHLRGGIGRGPDAPATPRRQRPIPPAPTGSGSGHGAAGGWLGPALPPLAPAPGEPRNGAAGPRLGPRRDPARGRGTSLGTLPGANVSLRAERAAAVPAGSVVPARLRRRDLRPDGAAGQRGGGTGPGTG